jgi:hypothetical protein
MQHFFPIAVIHVIIKDLGAMGQGGGPRRCGHGVEDRPKGLKDFTVDNAGAWNIIGCPSVKAVVLVAVNMEQADGVNDKDMVVDGKHVVALDAFQQFLPIFAIDVVYMQYMTNASNVCGRQRLTKGPIHVHLAFSLLKVDQGTRGETSVSRAGMAANSGAVRRIMGHLTIQLRSMAVACSGLDHSQFMIIGSSGCSLL